MPKVTRQYFETSLQDEVEEKDKNNRRKEERGKIEGRRGGRGNGVNGPHYLSTP